MNFPATCSHKLNNDRVEEGHPIQNVEGEEWRCACEHLSQFLLEPRLQTTRGKCAKFISSGFYTDAKKKHYSEKVGLCPSFVFRDPRLLRAWVATVFRPGDHKWLSSRRSGTFLARLSKTYFHNTLGSMGNFCHSVKPQVTSYIVTFLSFCQATSHNLHCHISSWFVCQCKSFVQST